MKSMNLEKISGLMDQFEKEFEDLDVQTSVMEGAMSQTTATNVPQDSVEVLMRQAADEAGLELKMDLPGPAESTVGQSTQVCFKKTTSLIDTKASYKGYGRKMSYSFFSLTLILLHLKAD